jgi:hypothetical protein
MTTLLMESMKIKPKVSRQQAILGTMKTIKKSSELGFFFEKTLSSLSLTPLNSQLTVRGLENQALKTHSGAPECLT